MTKNHRIIGHRIEDLGMTQAEFAKENGMSRSYFSQRMCGRHYWTQDDIILLCDKLNFTGEELLEIFFPTVKKGRDDQCAS